MLVTAVKQQQGLIGGAAKPGSIIKLGPVRDG
jgi:hypothetical protein